MKNLIIAKIMKEAFIVTHKYIPNNDTSYITLSHGIFEEMHEKKSKEKYFRTIFNTTTKKIEKFENADTLYNKYYFDPVAFALNMNPNKKQFTTFEAITEKIFTGSKLPFIV